MSVPVKVAGSNSRSAKPGSCPNLSQMARTSPTSFAGSTLYGWLVSPYTAKVRAMLAYKHIPFHDVSPSVSEMFLSLKPAVGRPIMPSVKLADGQWRQDSALICDEIEASHPERPTQPSGPTQRLASSLLELHGDEWLPMVALHYRWNMPQNKEWAVREFGRTGFPWLPELISSRLAAPFAQKMQSFKRVQGIGPETIPGIESFATQLISTLNTHLAEHDFLLGSAPCRGDFSLYGPLWAHLFRDPASRPLFDGAPHVVRWFERLHGHESDATSPPGAAAPAALFLRSDEVPATLDPIFRTLFAEQWPFLASLSRTIDEHLERPEADGRVPRAFGFAPFAVGGASGERRLVTFQAWKMHRVLHQYAALALAPSRALELSAVDRWLERLGGGAREAVATLRPRARLEREAKLPAAQDVLRAVAEGGPGPSSRL